jgi:hypothetical protein
MIKWMIKGHPTESVPRQARESHGSRMIKAHPTEIGWQGKPFSMRRPLGERLWPASPTGPETYCNIGQP